MHHVQTIDQRIIETICSDDTAIRNRTFEELLAGIQREDVVPLCATLEDFRKGTDNLYHRVRACLYLYAINYFIIPEFISAGANTHISGSSYIELEKADDENVITAILARMKQRAGTFSISEAYILSEAYYKAAFDCLFSQVKATIRESKDNKILFEICTLNEYPFKVPDWLIQEIGRGAFTQSLVESTPVRMDPSHSGWSDIFFLAMDFPEGARVVNVSIDLADDDGSPPRPPVQTSVRLIDKPMIIIRSLDLKLENVVNSTTELFHFNDSLGLLKAGIVASGLVPPSIKETGIELSDILERLLGKGLGIELTTRVNILPKGSRMAVSTTLLASIISLCMRLSGQTENVVGQLTENERRIVASRAILGEWLGGSGGGWQDSGGIWPGMKVITGQLADTHDPESRYARGKLLPDHRRVILSREIEENILNSFILFHGGLTQNIGPILQQVTEKYLLRNKKEWFARLRGKELFDAIVDNLEQGELKEVGRLTTLHYEECIKPIIPLAAHPFVEELRRRYQQKLGAEYWGFMMLGGATGGGMVFIVNPDARSKALHSLKVLMDELYDTYKNSVFFSVRPRILTFGLNKVGTVATFRKENEEEISQTDASGTVVVQQEPKRISKGSEHQCDQNTPGCFDEKIHATQRDNLVSGIYGIKQNNVIDVNEIETVRVDDIINLQKFTVAELNALKKRGDTALREGEFAVVTFSGGVGSRWSGGADIIKALDPFLEIEGNHRNFLEVHLAKTRCTAERFFPVQHVFTTSFMTHGPIVQALQKSGNFGYDGPVFLSPGQFCNLRFVPSKSELEKYWARNKGNNYRFSPEYKAMIGWIESSGEFSDFLCEHSHQRFYPPGHWFEIPFLFRNGTLANLIRQNPKVTYLLIHNLDTLGVSLDPCLCGFVAESRKMIHFEVIAKTIHDSGGVLASVKGKKRIVEGLALSDNSWLERCHLYNSLTSWLHIDSFLALLDVSRQELLEAQQSKTIANRLNISLEALSERIATYATLKEVNVREANSLSQNRLVLQLEKLWGDITALDDVTADYIAVDRFRGQQMKKKDMLDRWIRNGSLTKLESIMSFSKKITNFRHLEPAEDKLPPFSSFGFMKSCVSDQTSTYVH